MSTAKKRKVSRRERQWRDALARIDEIGWKAFLKECDTAVQRYLARKRSKTH